MDETDFISVERLRTYELHTDRRERAVALHNHTLQLGSSLMSMIALFELSLRNTANHCLIDQFGDEAWLVSGKKSVPLKDTEEKAARRAVNQAQKAAYAKLSHKEKGLMDALALAPGEGNGWSHDRKVKRRQAMFVVSHGQAISQTTFFFWKRLFSHEYDQTLWKQSLKRVFPNKKLKRSKVSKSLENVYATRNRVAHHEPVYGDRLTGAMNALEFLRNSLGAKSECEDTAFKRFSRVQHLRLRMDYESFLDAWRTLT